jgi:Resolvase, N terminal domain
LHDRRHIVVRKTGCEKQSSIYSITTNKVNLSPDQQTTPITIGYARVSTKDQTVAMQVDALKKAGCSKVYTAVMNGARSERLTTPLQFEQYLTRAFEEAYKIGQKPVGTDIVESVLAPMFSGRYTYPRTTRKQPLVSALVYHSLRNPIRACVPSQNGLLADPPQRHNLVA